MPQVKKALVVATMVLVVWAGFFLCPYETYYIVDYSKSNMLGVSVATVRFPIWLGWTMEKCDLAISQDVADKSEWEQAKKQLKWIEENSAMTPEEKQETKDWLIRGLGNNRYIQEN